MATIVKTTTTKKKKVCRAHLLVEQLWLQYEFNTYFKNRMNSTNKKSSRREKKRERKREKRYGADNKTNNKETVMLSERALCGIKLRIHLQILVLLFACLPTRSLSPPSFLSCRLLCSRHRFCRSFTLLFPCGALCMPNVSEKFPFSILILSHVVGWCCCCCDYYCCYYCCCCCSHYSNFSEQFRTVLFDCR